MQRRCVKLLAVLLGCKPKSPFILQRKRILFPPREQKSMSVWNFPIVTMAKKITSHKLHTYIKRLIMRHLEKKKAFVRKFNVSYFKYYFKLAATPGAV